MIHTDILMTSVKQLKRLNSYFCTQRRRDFLQLMLDARTSKESVSLENFDTASPAGELHYRNLQTQPSTSQQDNHVPPREPPSSRQQKKMITEDEIVGQAFVFLVAGYETSSNTLALTCYLLAIHPECQHKVQEEVDDFFSRHVRVFDWISFSFVIIQHFSWGNLWNYLMKIRIRFKTVIHLVFCCRSHLIIQMSRSWSI